MNKKVVNLHKKYDEVDFNSASTSVDVAREIVDSNKIEYGKVVVDFTFDQTIETLKTFGVFDNIERVNSKDIAALDLLIESLVYRYYGLDHGFHDVCDKIINIEDLEE